MAGLPAGPYALVAGMGAGGLAALARAVRATGDASVGNGMDYRQRLIQHYVTTHFAALRELSIDACERHRTTFQAYFQHLLPEDKEAKFLDIGCGYGSLLSMWLSASQSAKCLICE